MKLFKIKSKLHPFLLITFFMLTVNFYSHAGNSNNQVKKAMSEQENLVDKLFDAVEEKNLEAVKSLISNGLSPDAKNDNDETIIAALMRIDGHIPNRQEIVNYLIEQGADVNPVTGSGLTLLHITALADMFSTVELLLDRKIDTTAKTSFGKTAIFYTNSAKMIELLISKKAGSYQDVDDDGNTLLHRAGGIQPNFKLIKYFIKHIDINSKNENGNTILLDILNLGDEPDEVEEIVVYLLSNGADVNLTGQYGRTPIMAALRNRKLNLSIVEKIMEAGADLSQKDEDSSLALHYAAANNLSYLKFLVDKNADINAVTGDNETALILASQFSLKEVVAYLIANNGDLNIKDSHGKTALNYAMEREYSDIVVMLNDKNAVATPQSDIDEISETAKSKKAEEAKRKKNEINNLKSAIRLKNLEEVKKYYKEKISSTESENINMYKIGMYTIENGNLEIFVYLINNGLDINSKDKDEYSFLHDAVFNNEIEIAKFLIKEGLDVNYVSGDDSSVFSMSANSSVDMVDFLKDSGVKINKEKEASIVLSAIGFRNIEMAKYFIQQGYEFDKAIFENDDYLIKLVQKQNIKMLTYLIEKGFDIETRVSVYGDDITMLHLAVLIEAAIVVDYLLAEGANPNAKNSANKPIFPDALKNGNLDIVTALFDNGADLNETSGHYEHTPLLMAIESKNISIIRYLIDKGANVNTIDRVDKNSALHMAAQNGYLEILKSMVSHDGNVHLLNKARKAPLDVAIMHQQKAAESYLREMEEKVSP